MLKNILNVKDAQQINKKEQKLIQGGFGPEPSGFGFRTCNGIQFKPVDVPCPTGTVPHPTKPHCFCCAV